MNRKLVFNELISYTIHGFELIIVIDKLSFLKYNLFCRFRGDIYEMDPSSIT